MHTQDIEYTVDGQRYLGYLAVDRDKPGKRPGVLIAPEGGGLGELNMARARELAKLGYVAFAIDYHGDRKQLEMQPMMERLAVLRADPTTIRSITRAALGVLVAQAETDAARIAAIGYCYGGTAVLELARSGADVACTVGFHSGLATARPEDARNIKGKVLVCIGADDPLISPEGDRERQGVQPPRRGDAKKRDAEADAWRPLFLAPWRLGGCTPWRPRGRAMRDLFDETFGPV